MKKTLKKYERSFKVKAVLLSYEVGCIEQVEKELDISPTLLNRWRQDYEQYGEGSFCGHGNLRMSPEQKTIHQLEKRIKKAELEAGILKKAIPFLRQGKSGAIQFIEDHKDTYTLKMLCGVLGISAHTYRKWKNQFVSETQLQRATVNKEITRLFYKAKKRYGCARITIELQKLGFQITSATVGRRMRALGLYVSVKRQR